ncbi:GntR family transcriptional regulator [Prauserella cavernicola]|uniref:GntR family transcriptional regulator n=1 Tax=Prauserella cavernicola TaxID=2800127 RepID=A0A934QTF2_9PSEU|nr:GntR family transcriptional regulator [Prauserella cavernicola]MBK1786002.1 GntR family transcriptional regulator [Prauserella cavernicola]
MTNGGDAGRSSEVPLLASLERPRKLGDIVLDQVRELIVSKRLAPGSRLSEAKIAGILEVSKTPVREALLQLRMIGLVEIVDGSAHVVVPSAMLIREAYEVRSGLEALTARLAAQRADVGHQNEILAAADASHLAAKNGDRRAFAEHDHRFHWSIAVASGNDTARNRVEESLILCQTLRQRDVLSEWDSQVCGEAHVDIANAIRDRAAGAAAELAAAHVTYVMAKILAQFTNE